MPSNLSTRLRQLEEQLGVDLFLRERQRLQLSPAGKVLLDYAARLFACRRRRARRCRGEPVGDFALGSMYSTAAIHLPPRLAEYHRRYPAVNLQCRPRPAASWSSRCWAGAWMPCWWTARWTSTVWRACRCSRSAWCWSPRMATRRCAVRGRGRQRGDRLPPALLYRLLLESWFASARVSMGRVMEIESYHSMLACVVAGGGVALMPVSMLQSLPGRESVAVHALAEPFARANTWLVWRKGHGRRQPEGLDRSPARAGIGVGLIQVRVRGRFPAVKLFLDGVERAESGTPVYSFLGRPDLSGRPILPWTRGLS